MTGKVPMLLFVSLDDVFVSRYAGWLTSDPQMSGAGVMAGPFRLSLLALVLFLYIGYTDAVSLRIPDRAAGLLFLLGCVSLAKGYGSFPADLIAGASLALPMLLTDLIRRGSFGMGDIKLCLAAGPLLGWERLFFGGLYGLILLQRKSKQDVFPLGPFLLAGFTWMLVMGG